MYTVHRGIKFPAIVGYWDLGTMKLGYMGPLKLEYLGSNILVRYEAKNLQLLDIQACNSANKASFLNPTKSLSFAQCYRDGQISLFK